MIGTTLSEAIGRLLDLFTDAPLAVLAGLPALGWFAQAEGPRTRPGAPPTPAAPSEPWTHEEFLAAGLGAFGVLMLLIIVVHVARTIWEEGSSPYPMTAVRLPARPRHRPSPPEGA